MVTTKKKKKKKKKRFGLVSSYLTMALLLFRNYM